MPPKIVVTNRDEHLWSKAKAIAKKQYKVSEGSDKFYKIVMGIYNNMKGGSIIKSINSEDAMNTNLILTEYPLLEKAHVENQGDSLNSEHLEDYPLLQKARVKSHPRKMKSGKVVQVREHRDSRKELITAEKKTMIRIALIAGLKNAGIAPEQVKIIISPKHGRIDVYNRNMKTPTYGGKKMSPLITSITVGDEGNKKIHQFIKKYLEDEKEFQEYSKKNKSLESFPLLQKAHVKQHPRKMKSGRITQVREHETSVQKKRAEEEIKSRGGVEQSNKYENNYLGYENDVKAELKRQFPKLTETKVNDLVYKKYERTIQAEWNKEKSTPPAQVAKNIMISKTKTDAKVKTKNNQPISKKRYTEQGKTIHSQVGQKALVMMGAKNLGIGQDKNGLGYFSFRIGKNSKGINYVKIQLNGMDTYDVEFGAIRAGNYKVKSTAKNIYVDQLHKILESHTGMRMSIGMVEKSIKRKLQIGDPKMKSTERPVLDSVKFPILAEAHANLKKSMSFKINGQKLKTAIDGKIATCKGELIVLEKEYPPVAVNSDEASGKVQAEGEEVPVTKNEVEVKVTVHWKVRSKKREIEELETYARNINVKISYNLDKYELSQFGL